MSMTPYFPSDEFSLRHRMCETHYSSYHKDWETGEQTFIFEDNSFISFDGLTVAGWGDNYE